MADNLPFYRLLGLPKNASDADIKKAYRNLALKHHPDKGGDQDQFKAISEAYEVLSDPEKRQIYDVHGEYKPNNAPQFHDPFQLFRNLFEGGGGFNFGAFGGRPRQEKCHPVVINIDLSLENIFSGVNHNFTIPNLTQPCPVCLNNSSQCHTCNGFGVRTVRQMIGPGMIRQFQVPCDTCHNTGVCTKDGDKCQICQGKRVVEYTKHFGIAIPAGITEQDTIVMQNIGHQFPGKLPGDIHINVKTSPHTTFERRDNDLHVKRRISLLDALTGFQFPIVMLNGVETMVQCHSIIPEQSITKRLINEGLPHRNNPGIKGSLVFQFDIDYPTQILSTHTEAKTLEQHLQMTRLMPAIIPDHTGPIFRI